MQGPQGCAQNTWRYQPDGYLREVLTARVYDVAVQTPLVRDTHTHAHTHAYMDRDTHTHIDTQAGRWKTPGSPARHVVMHGV